MKTKATRLLSLLLVLIMVAGLLPTVAMAAQQAFTVVKTGSTEVKQFYTIDAAWEEVIIDGGVLTMKANATPGSSLDVPEGKNVKIVGNGHTINRGLKTAVDNGQVFLLRKKATLTLTNLTVTGGNNNGGGGGIHLQESAVLKLENVTITQNYTRETNGGAGIRLQGKNSYVSMDENTVITDNDSMVDSGGGISLMGEGATISGGNAQVYENYTVKNGGAIHCGAENCAVSDLRIYNNEAENNGGAIFMSEGHGFAVSNCKIYNNIARKNGGGIYVNGNGGSLSNSTVTGNIADNQGGGIYIDDGDTLSLSGKLSVYGNTGNGSTGTYDDNLYLDTDSGNLGYISGTPSEPMVEGELVHIGWNTAKRTGNPTRISNKKGTNDVRYLVSDVPDYTIYWSWGANDGINDRKIRAATSNKYSIPVIPTTDIPAAYRYDKDYTEYNGYDVQRGLFSYKATEGDDRQALYYYSDGYFAEDPAVYNNHLATMSLALTMSAFNSAGSEFDDTDQEVGGYMNRARNAIQLLGDLGFKTENVHVSETFLKKPTDSSIGVIMGAKKLTTPYENGKPCILVPIAVRGAGYEMEWVSNVTLGSSGEAAGFSDAADQVMFELYLFMKEENNSIDLQEALDEGRVKFWVTGFSRSAATANLTAKRLTDEYCANGNEVFAYCYEAPKGGVTKAITVNAAYNYYGEYHNIHNIINKSDIVPYVGPAEMGFFRYGVDHFVPGTAAGTVSTETFTYGSNVKFDQYYDNKGIEVTRSTKDTYYKQRSIMTQHLGAVDSRILFDDYFNVASMEYVFNKFFGIDMVHELSKWDYVTAAEWIPRFFKDLQEWACQYTYNDGKKVNKHNGDFRKFYSTHREFAGMADQPTVEEALQAAVTVVFGLDDTAQLMDAMMYRLSKLDLMSLYWNEIWWYYHGTYTQQQNTINKLWNQLNKSMTRYGESVPALRDLVTPEQYSKIEAAFPTLISFLLQFINEDYWGSPLEADEMQSPPTQVHLGTLAYNLSGVLQNHYPEVCMAWLRTYDSFYTTDSGTLEFDAGSEYVLTDKTVADSARIYLNGTTVHKDNYTSGVEIVLEPTGSVIDAEGSAIYYRLEGWGGNSGYVCDWSLYDGPFYAGAFTDTNEDTRVDLQVKVVRYQKASTIQNVSFTITPLRKHVLTVQNSFDNNIRNFYVMAGEQMTIQSPFDKEIWKWVVEKDDGTITDVIPSEDNKDATGTAEEFVITMPNEALYYTVFYKKEVSLLDMIGLRPVAGEILPSGALTMYTHHFNAYLTVPQETVTTQVQWLDADGKDVTGDTAEEGVAYKAVVTVTAYEAPEKDDKPIQPAIFTNATAANVMGAQAVSVEKQSSTVAVVTCEFPAAQNAQTHILDVQTYDLNLQSETTTEGNLPEGFALEYAEGTVVSVPAPVFDNMEFVKWQVDDAIAAASPELTNETLTFTVPYYDEANQTMTVTAQYKPVINKISIQIPWLEEGGTFPTSVTAATVTVRNDYNIDPAGITVEWEPTDDQTVVAGNSYTAYIYADQFNIDLEDGSSVSGNVTFNSSTEAYINGKKTPLLFSGDKPMVVWDTSTSVVVEQIITDIIEPSDINVTRDADGNLPADIELPAKVTVKSTNALLTSVAVENWNYSYNSSSLEAQQITCVGTLVIPEGVTIADNVRAKDADPEAEGFQVSLTVYTKAADQADMPEAMPDSGEYTGTVSLTAEEGSTIYYTTDGITTPTTESNVYTDAITVEPTFDDPVTIMAIAVVDGKLPSDVAVFTYTAPAAEDNTTTFHIHGHNVRLQDMLRIGFYLYVETTRDFEAFGVLVSTDPVAVAAAEGDDSNSSSVTNKILTSESSTINGIATDIYTYETDGIRPQNLDTVYYLKPYIRIDGQYIYGDVDDYSVLEYAEYVYKKSSDDDLKSIVIDLMNYATAARSYFCYTEGLEQLEKPFNSFMTPADQTVAWDKDKHNFVCQGVDEAGDLDAVYYGKNANILEAISIGVYFQDTRVLGGLYWNSTKYEANTVHDETTATGTAVMRDDLGEGYVKLSVPGIYSFNIYDTYYLRGCGVDGVLTDTYVLNVAAYLSELIKITEEQPADETQEALVSLCKAMQVYGRNAKTYFAKEGASE